MRGGGGHQSAISGGSHFQADENCSVGDYAVKLYHTIMIINRLDILIMCSLCVCS